MAKKEEPALREVKFDQQLQQMVYVRSARAIKVLPYHGTRVSNVEEFSDESLSKENDYRPESEHYSILENKLLAEITKKGQALKADAYEIVVEQRDDEDLSDYDEEDEEMVYSVLLAAIFYRKN